MVIITYDLKHNPNNFALRISSITPRVVYHLFTSITNTDTTVTTNTSYHRRSLKTSRVTSLSGIRVLKIFVKKWDVEGMEIYFFSNDFLPRFSFTVFRNVHI